MQGTVVMLMALSGLGCHNKSCDVVYAPPTYSCFSSGCYANVIRPTMFRRRATRGVIRVAIAAVTRGATAGIMDVGFFPSFLAASSTLAVATEAAMAVTAAGTVATAAGTAALAGRHTAALPATTLHTHLRFRVRTSVQLRRNGQFPGPVGHDWPVGDALGSGSPCAA